MDLETTYIKEVFENMMPYIRENYDPNDQERPYFMYGRRHEILDLLSQKDNAEDYKYRKYPLIILYHSQPESHGGNINFEYEGNFLVSIVTESKKEWITDERYNETVENILYPIYNYLLQEIAENPCFYASYKEGIEHTLKVWDGNPSDNKTTGLFLNDYLDGLDIQFSGLKVFKQRTNCQKMTAH